MSSEEENKALVRRFYAEMDAGNWSARDDLGLMAQLGVSQLPGPPG
jgi:hypothetical protein